MTGSSLLWWLGRVAALSPAETATLIRHPWKLNLKIMGPRPLMSVEAVRRLFPDVTLAEAEGRRVEFLGSHAFHEAINRNLVTVRGRRMELLPWHEFLYMAIRIQRPETVVETGVFDGQSSAIILQAMHRNGKGRLVSIDLPAVKTIPNSTDLMPETTLPPRRGPGWLIPEDLRSRHVLVLGDSGELLPRVLRQLESIDLFFHDSLHTPEHQFFEYEIAWRYLSLDGTLLSDDVLATPAFHQFCRQIQRDYLRVETLGAVRKRARNIPPSVT